MRRRLLSALLILVMVLGLLPAGVTTVEAVDADTTADQWLNEGDRELVVCGVTVTADNAGNILAGTAYESCGQAEFALVQSGGAVRPTLTLTGLNVEDRSLDNIVKYTGSGLNMGDLYRAQDDILYLQIVGTNTFHADQADIDVENASLDLSGPSGGTLTLESSWATELEVTNGDLHIHDIILTAGGTDGGIQVTNGTLTVSGEDTVVTSSAGQAGRGARTLPVYELYSMDPLSLEDILVLNDGLAFTAPAGAKAVLESEERTGADQNGQEISVYVYTVCIVDENDEDISSDLVIQKPHAHAVEGADVTFGHTLASYSEEYEEDGETKTFCCLLVDDREWTDWDRDTGNLVIRNDLPAGGYYLTDSIDFNQGLEINAGTVNLCLNGFTLEPGGTVRVEDNAKLTLSDCGDGGSIRLTGSSIYVAAGTYYSSPGRLVVESGRINGIRDDTLPNPNRAAIKTAGHVTLRGGEVSGPYGVEINYPPNTAYAKSLLTLTGAPEVTGSTADIRILYDTDKLTDLSLIDARDYTGETLTVEFAFNDGEIGDYLTLPIVELGDTPADKFTLTNQGYCLEKMLVDGENCLVLAETPPVQAKWGADAEHLTNQGSLNEALEAAAADSAVAYIQMVADATASPLKNFNADGGTFTLDLNGHTIQGGRGGSAFGNCSGGSALSVDGANVTLTGTGTLRGGLGGSYTGTSTSNRGGRGIWVWSGSLTVDSGGVTVTSGLPGENHTGANPAGGSEALNITGGTVILKGGTYDASPKKDGSGAVIQRSDDAIYAVDGTLTVPQGSSLLATAAGGTALYIRGTAVNIAGGTFGDPHALPNCGILAEDGTCGISGGSISGEIYGLRVSDDEARVTLSGGTYHVPASSTRSAVEPYTMRDTSMTYASLLKAGYGFSADGSTFLTEERELSQAKDLSVIPLPHTHDWAGAWSGDAAHHWHECSAQGCPATENSQKDGYAAHTWNGGVVTTPPTASAEGVKTYTCTVCQATRTEAAPKPEQPTFAISGTVTDHEDQGLASATVKLMRGNQAAATTTTDSQGNYSFAGVPAGLYNVAAEKDSVTKTILVEIINQNAANKNIQMPEGKKNSVVEVKDNTPAVVAGGVDGIAESETVSAGETVTVKLTVEKKERPADKTEIDNAAQGKTVELYLDLSLLKTVVSGGDTLESPITDTRGRVLTIVVPYDFTGKTGVTVYRSHGGSAAALSALASVPGAPADGTFHADSANGRITIYAAKFSTYAIGYTAAGQTAYTLTVNGGTGSGSYAPGTTVNISAAVPAGKRFAGWTGAAVADPGSAGTTLIMPAHDTTVTANFQTVSGGGGSGGGSGSGPATYPVETPSTAGGKVTASHKSAASGTTVTLTLTPDQGYTVSGVTVTDRNSRKITVTDKGNGKYTFTMPGGAVTVKAAFAPLPDDTERPCDGGADCPSRGFTDLGTVGTWYHEAVDYILRNNLMSGYGNGTFGPNNNLTRAQFAQILYNREGRPVVDYPLQYGDVADGAWYTEAVRWATSRGIVGGYADGRFGPNDNIAREQLAVMLWRYAESPSAAGGELRFADADKAGGYALEALRWAVEHGIISGYGNGQLSPRGLATRAQAAQMLMNFWEK